MPTVSHHTDEIGRLDLQQTLAGLSNHTPVNVQRKKERPVLSDLQITKTSELKPNGVINICLVDRKKVLRTEAKVLTKAYKTDGKWFISILIDGNKVEYSLDEYSVVPDQNGDWSQTKWFEKT